MICIWKQKLKFPAYICVCNTKGHLHRHTHECTQKRIVLLFLIILLGLPIWGLNLSFIFHI